MRNALECDNYRDDEDGIHCIARAIQCKFIHRQNCKDFITVIDAQKQADFQQGTNFAAMFYGCVTFVVVAWSLYAFIFGWGAS